MQKVQLRCSKLECFVDEDIGRCNVRNVADVNSYQSDVFISGNATLSPDEAMLLVDNLSTGKFDAYCFPASMPMTTFSPTSVRRFTKQCAFLETGKIAICRTDHRAVEVVDIATGDSLQSLRPSGGEYLETLFTMLLIPH